MIGDQPVAVGPHQPPRMFQRRIVAVDDGDLVAMAHRAQGRQQFGPEDGGYADQHGLSPPAETRRSRRPGSGRKAAGWRRRARAHGCRPCLRAPAARVRPSASIFCSASPIAATRRGAHRSRHPAVDHRRLEVDDRGCRDDGVGERRRRPRRSMRRAPRRARPSPRGDVHRCEASRPLRVERLFQHGDRGDVDQLARRAAGAGHRHRAERAGIAGRAAVEPAVEHDAAAGEGADVEIDEVARRAAVCRTPVRRRRPRSRRSADRRESCTCAWMSARMSRLRQCVHHLARRARRRRPSSTARTAWRCRARRCACPAPASARRACA